MDTLFLCKARDEVKILQLFCLLCTNMTIELAVTVIHHQVDDDFDVKVLF